MREILLEMVAELQDLRASLAAIAAQPLTAAAAQDAKTLANQANKDSYDKLRKKIEALP